MSTSRDTPDRSVSEDDRSQDGWSESDLDQMEESDRIESEVSDNSDYYSARSEDATGEDLTEEDRSASENQDGESEDDPGSETDFLDDEDEKEDYTQEEAIKEMNRAKLEKYQYKLTQYEYSENLSRSPSERRQFDRSMSRNRSRSQVEVVADSSERLDNFFTNPNIVDDYYEMVVTYPDGRQLDIARVMIAPLIVLDNGDIIRLNDDLTILNRLKNVGLEIQESIPVTVSLGGLEYRGYQYTPMPSKYRIPTKIPEYSRKQMIKLRREIDLASGVDTDAIHFGIRWTGREYRFFGRIADPAPPSDYREEVDLFTTYLNHLYSPKLSRAELSDIQTYILP